MKEKYFNLKDIGQNKVVLACIILPGIFLGLYALGYTTHFVYDIICHLFF